MRRTFKIARRESIHRQTEGGAEGRGLQLRDQRAGLLHASCARQHAGELTDGDRVPRRAGIPDFGKPERVGDRAALEMVAAQHDCRVRRSNAAIELQHLFVSGVRFGIPTQRAEADRQRPSRKPVHGILGERVLQVIDCFVGAPGMREEEVRALDAHL